MEDTSFFFLSPHSLNFLFFLPSVPFSPTSTLSHPSFISEMNKLQHQHSHEPTIQLLPNTQPIGIPMLETHIKSDHTKPIIHRNSNSPHHASPKKKKKKSLATQQPSIVPNTFFQPLSANPRGTRSISKNPAVVSNQTAPPIQFSSAASSPEDSVSRATSEPSFNAPSYKTHHHVNPNCHCFLYCFTISCIPRNYSHLEHHCSLSKFVHVWRVNNYIQFLSIHFFEYTFQQILYYILYLI